MAETQTQHLENEDNLYLEIAEGLIKQNTLKFATPPSKQTKIQSAKKWFARLLASPELRNSICSTTKKLREKTNIEEYQEIIDATAICITSYIATPEIAAVAYPAAKLLIKKGINNYCNPDHHDK